MHWPAEKRSWSDVLRADLGNTTGPAVLFLSGRYQYTCGWQHGKTVWYDIRKLQDAVWCATFIEKLTVARLVLIYKVSYINKATNVPFLICTHLFINIMLNVIILLCLDFPSRFLHSGCSNPVSYAIVINHMNSVCPTKVIWSIYNIHFEIFFILVLNRGLKYFPTQLFFCCFWQGLCWICEFGTLFTLNSYLCVCGRECLFDLPSLSTCCPLSYQTVAVILLSCMSTVLSLNWLHRIDVVLCTVDKP